jgi:DNA-binding transcriptional MocR family regulator
MYNKTINSSIAVFLNCTSTMIKKTFFGESIMQKHELVRNYIIEKLRNGELKKGQRLPSCREVAGELSVNKITVNKAYCTMEEDHILYSIPRGGFYVVDDMKNIVIKQKIYDFATVTPEQKLIPYREFSHVINKAVEHYKNDLFSYEATAGLLTLRQTLKEMFETSAIYTEPHRVVITNGAQQAICLLLQMLFKNSKGKLLLEAPTYNLVLSIAEMNEIETLSIPRNKNGFDLIKLEKLFKNNDITVFYIIPRHHNPTGFSLEEKHKKRIAELADKYDILILEDDYLADLSSKKGSMPIHYYDTHDRTIYIRSFSKTFMPGIRLGAVVLPETLTKSFTELKRITDLNTSRLPQAALDLFIKSGMYEKHVQKVRKTYEQKLRNSKEIIEALSPTWIDWYVPSHGFFIWGEIKNSKHDFELEKLLADNNVLIKTGSLSYPRISTVQELAPISETQSNCIRLCISCIPMEDLKEGLCRMMELLNSL